MVAGASLIARVVSRERLVAGAVALTVRPRNNVLLALEQLVAAMQGEVITALTAASQAEQRATDAETRVLGVRGEGVVDTRLLGKPKSFDGSTGQLETVQVHVLGPRWRSRLKTQTGDDRERGAAGGIDHELSLACQRPAGLHTVVPHVSLALGGFSSTIAGTFR